MVRKVFFSFHYENDVWRTNQIRNSWITKDIEDAGFIDKAEFEDVKKKGEDAIKKWIDKQLEGTSVTVVLIGSETSERKYVNYEIEQSHDKGNGLLGIYIHKQKDQNGKTDKKGKNPFDNHYIKENNKKKYFSEIYPTYDWDNDGGYNNIGDWIEKAAKDAGRSSKSRSLIEIFGGWLKW